MPGHCKTAELQACYVRCTEGEALRFALADVNRLLSACSAEGLKEAVRVEPSVRLAPFAANYVAALIEQACCRHELAVPNWVSSVAPLDVPVFASELESLRLHLLTASPAAFRRRNLFVDASLGAQV
jgi:hypothetical protein